MSAFQPDRHPRDGGLWVPARSTVPTDREREVLAALAEIGSYIGAAVALGISVRAVDATVERVKARTGTHGWRETARAMGLLP